MMGTSTMRKENLETSLRCTPSSRPVEMVVPERDRPGRTASACARPMMNAFLGVIVPVRGLASPAKVSRHAVTSSMMPTSTRLEVKSPSMASLQKKPTPAMGIMEMSRLMTYRVSSFIRNRNSPLNSATI